MASETRGQPSSCDTGTSDESEHVGLMFAAHAGVAYAGAQQQASLSRTLSRTVETRQVIGRA